MKYTVGTFILLITFSIPLRAQSTEDLKKYQIGIGTNYFPLYLFIKTPGIDNYGAMFSYQYKLNPRMGIRTGVLYNTRVGIGNATKLDHKGYFIGTHLGITHQLFSIKRWELYTAFDIVGVFSKNDKHIFPPAVVAYGRKYQAGLGLGINYHINQSFFLQSETNLTYGSMLSKDILDGKTVDEINYWGYYFFKFGSLQLFYKF